MLAVLQVLVGVFDAVGRVQLRDGLFKKVCRLALKVAVVVWWWYGGWIYGRSSNMVVKAVRWWWGLKVWW